jgi:hypothetical protein
MYSVQNYMVMLARAGEGVVRERLKNLEISSRLLPSSSSARGR